jgi:hypothetical protein
MLPLYPGIPDKIERGDVEKTFEDPSLTIIGVICFFFFFRALVNPTTEGESQFGSQYAFYMEPQVRGGR